MCGRRRQRHSVGVRIVIFRIAPARRLRGCRPSHTNERAPSAHTVPTQAPLPDRSPFRALTAPPSSPPTANVREVGGVGASPRCRHTTAPTYADLGLEPRKSRPALNLPLTPSGPVSGQMGTVDYIMYEPRRMEVTALRATPSRCAARCPLSHRFVVGSFEPDPTPPIACPLAIPPACPSSQSPCALC